MHALSSRTRTACALTIECTSFTPSGATEKPEPYSTHENAPLR